jgi:hypothetical protein
MTEDDLVKHYPRLWHMAEDGSFDSIRNNGLLSTTALLDLYGISGEEREALVRRHRPECVTIRNEGLPDAVVRDQKPMREEVLKGCLTGGLTPADWYEILNERTFFWLSRDRLRSLLGARAYRNRPHTVLTVNTESLLNVHRDRIELSPLNSGATLYDPLPRGRETFSAIADYPFEERRKTRTLANSVVELVVRGGVLDIGDHLVAAHRVRNGNREELWRKPGTGADDGP